MNSWKTTSTGMLMLIGAAVTLWFDRNRLTPQIIMGAATTGLAGIGLILARDNDKSSEDVGAKPAAPSARTGVTGLLMLLFCGGLLAVALSAGCQSPPQRVAFNTVQAPAVTADTAMKVWGDYVKQYHPGPAAERKVYAIYKRAKAAELAAIDAAHLAADSAGSTNSVPITQTLQSPEASAALSDLVDAIRSFGCKL